MARKTVTMDQIDPGLRAAQRSHHHLEIQWTKEMDKDLIDARVKMDPPVTYPALKRFFKKKYGCGSESTLRNRLRELKSEGKA